MLSWLADWLWGYDFFVSYARKDGCIEECGQSRSRYVRSLVHQLRNYKEKFSVFHDETEYDPGTELNAATKRRVRFSTKLLVVARPAAMLSDWVLKEVYEAIKARNDVVVIDVNRTYETAPYNHPLRAAIGESRLRFPETLASLDDEPSEDLLNKLRDVPEVSTRTTASASNHRCCTYPCVGFPVCVLVRRDSEFGLLRDLEKRTQIFGNSEFVATNLSSEATSSG